RRQRHLPSDLAKRGVVCRAGDDRHGVRAGGFRRADGTDRPAFLYGALRADDVSLRCTEEAAGSTPAQRGFGPYHDRQIVFLKIGGEKMTTINPGDTAFLLTCTALVCMMTPALALFY